MLMKAIQTELKWALIFIVMMLAWLLMEKLLGFHDKRISQHYIISSLIFIPAVTIYVLALLDKRKNDYGGKMTYLQGLRSGLIITGIVALFTPLTQLIISKIITPHYFDNMIAYSVESEKMSKELALSTFNLKSYIIQGTIGALIMGTLTAAIVALFTRKQV